jgi:DNA modification methylase
MLIEKMKISDLVPAPYNPRKSNAKQEQDLKNSLEKFGVVEPIIFNKQTGFIVGGHFRVRELKKLGYTEVECVIVDLSPEDEKELNVRLNANTGEFDWEQLNSWDKIKLEEWGLDVSNFEDEVLEAVEDDFDTTLQEEAITVLGDLYEIGEHRLLCGNSTDSDQVAKLMNGQKADMVFTDPPYGMNLDTDYSKMPSTKKEGNKNYNKIKGDNEDFTDELINTIFACFNDCKEIFIWGADYFAELLPNKNQGSWIVWDKRVEEKFDKMIGSAFELCWSKSKHQRQIARFNNTLFSGEQDARNKVHPTQKPIKLACWFLEQWSAKENLIADLFLGSGSTMVASHQLKRKCYGMELDCKYVDVIVKRMLKLDKTLKIKKNGIDETETWLKLIE